MEACVGEECGIVGIFSKKKDNPEIISRALYEMLLQVQHRGQLSAGVAIHKNFEDSDGRVLRNFKDVGRVNDLFKIYDRKKSSEIFDFLSGNAGIGHVRYATSGKSRDYLKQFEEAQPFFRRHGRLWKRFAIAFNGNIANHSSLREELLSRGYTLDTSVDTEILMHLFALSLNRNSSSVEPAKPDFFQVAAEVMSKLDGAYNILLLFGTGDLVLIRDPHGFKPIVYGENENYFAVASESPALEKIGINNFYSLEPGACLIYNKDGLQIKSLIPHAKKSRCHFERVYFSRADSIVDGVSINKTRDRLGRGLAEIEPLKEKIKQNPSDYLVVPVPSTSIPAAEAFSNSLNIPWSMAIVKNENERGFINYPDERKRIMSSKYSVISERVKDKKIILIEDSIVRGETSKKVISLVRNAGAKEVHFRATEPPIKYPCFYGIDFPTYDELIANKYSANELNKKVAEEIGADSVSFLNLKGLIESMVIPENELCLACLTGNYPTLAGQKLAEESKKIRDTVILSG